MWKIIEKVEDSGVFTNWLIEFAELIERKRIHDSDAPFSPYIGEYYQSLDSYFLISYLNPPVLHKVELLPKQSTDINPKPHETI